MVSNELSKIISIIISSSGTIFYSSKASESSERFILKWLHYT